jgi:apolipoprotein D and lipocalin family protein
MPRFTFAAVSLLTLLMFTACQSGPQRGDPPMAIASHVDLPRFMGDWYVHGYTPTALDPNAFNPVETYTLDLDGTIATTYRFNKGGFDGPVKTYHPRARVFDRTSNAEWRMLFFGIINSPYLILHVSDDYQETVVAHPNRKLAWIMTRTSPITDARYAALKGVLEARNFELSKLIRAQHALPAGQTTD